MSATGGASRIALGSVYRPPAVPYPRVLVMRRWPRGVRKSAVDRWERELGPSDALLDAYRAGVLDWAAFARRYAGEIAAQPEAVARVAALAATTGVTLLCGSHPEERCHRSLLARAIERLLAADGGERGPGRSPAPRRRAPGRGAGGPAGAGGRPRARGS